MGLGEFHMYSQVPSPGGANVCSAGHSLVISAGHPPAQDIPTRHHFMHAPTCIEDGDVFDGVGQVGGQLLQARHHGARLRVGASAGGRAQMRR